MPDARGCGRQRQSARQPNSTVQETSPATTTNCTGVGRSNTSPRRAARSRPCTPRRLAPSGRRLAPRAPDASHPIAVPTRNGAATIAMPPTASPSEWLVRPNATNATTVAASRQTARYGRGSASIDEARRDSAAAARRPWRCRDCGPDPGASDGSAAGPTLVRLKTSQPAAGTAPIAPRCRRGYPSCSSRAAPRRAPRRRGERLLARELGRHVMRQPPLGGQRMLAPAASKARPGPSARSSAAPASRIGVRPRHDPRRRRPTRKGPGAPRRRPAAAMLAARTSPSRARYSAASTRMGIHPSASRPVARSTRGRCAGIQISGGRSP